MNKTEKRLTLTDDIIHRIWRQHIQALLGHHPFLPTHNGINDIIHQC